MQNNMTVKHVQWTYPNFPATFPSRTVTVREFQ